MKGENVPKIEYIHSSMNSHQANPLMVIGALLSIPLLYMLLSDIYK